MLCHPEIAIEAVITTMTDGSAGVSKNCPIGHASAHESRNRANPTRPDRTLSWATCERERVRSVTTEDPRPESATSMTTPT